MTSGDLIHVLIGLLILSAAGLKLGQLRRADAGPGRGAVVAMCVAVASIGVTALQQAPSGAAFLAAHLGLPFAYAQGHTTALVSYGCLPIAFLCWLRPPGPARRRLVAISVGILVAVLGARWALAATAAPADAAAALVGDWTHAPRTVWAVLLYTIYGGATVGSSTVMAHRWARRLRSEQPSTALGLRILVGVGVLFGIYVVHKVAFMAYVLVTRVPPPYNPETAQQPIVVLGVVALAAGLCVPLVASVARRVGERWHQLQAHRRLRPLWAALTEHHPGVVMPLTPAWLPGGLSRVWDAFDPREVELRLFRRTIECWDVLTRLHGHLDVRVRDEALRAAQAARVGERAPAVAAAVMIRRGLGGIDADGEPIEPCHRAGPPLQDGELADNVAWWQRVSAEWDDPLTARLARRSPVLVPAGGHAGDHGVRS